jgi:shikimate dehydrogenase
MTKKLKAGVVGWPVKHSISPILHRFWLEENKINGEYGLFTVMPDKFEAFMLNLPHENIKGLNITLPYKQEALKFCDSIDAAAKRAGAVNTIVIDRDRKLFGTNTDIYGFVQNLKSRFPQWSPESAPVAVIGSGGAARAVIIGLQDHLNVKNIKLFNRSKNRALKLSTDLGGSITVLNLNQLSSELSDVSMLINTTSLGMSGQNKLEINITHLPKKCIVYDIVYSPLKTRLLEAARDQGNPTVDGLGMLLYQAQPGFESWFGVKPNVTESLRAHVLCALEK